MAKKIAKKKESFELNVPEDFNGEVVATVSGGSGDKIGLLTRDFHNEELNVLRDKINEIISK